MAAAEKPACLAPSARPEVEYLREHSSPSHHPNRQIADPAVVDRKEVAHRGAAVAHKVAQIVRPSVAQPEVGQVPHRPTEAAVRRADVRLVIESARLLPMAEGLHHLQVVAKLARRLPMVAAEPNQ